MTRITTTIIMMLVTMYIAACSDHYRYPCQDPENWKKEECVLPKCAASGVCTKDVLPEKVLGIDVTKESTIAKEGVKK